MFVIQGMARRSLDLSSLDDIPEERILSGTSSEEKEITRVDSGLGEWDSESSRKTSFSSQGRLSPDFAPEKTTKVFVLFFLFQLSDYVSNIGLNFANKSI